MLLGSKYLSIFPKEVHTLPCGLTIYRSQLASHGGQFDSCIGGPHSSFTALAGLAGGTSQLIASFIDGLQSYRQWGAPKINSISMSEEELLLAMEFNKEELGLTELVQLDSADDNNENSGQLHVEAATTFESVQAINSTVLEDHVCCC